MFQTEPVLWLQAHVPPPLGWLLWAVSLVGQVPVYAALLLALAFGQRVRSGLTLLAAVLLAGVLSEGLKHGFGLPRPHDVDARIDTALAAAPPALVSRGGASSPLSLPPSEAIATVRAVARESFGFPSGHTASATAAALGLALVLRSRPAWLFALCWALMMSLSRLYLGRHFLADVIGGIGVGGLAVGLAFLVAPADRRAGRRRSLMMPLLALGLVLAALGPAGGWLQPWYVGAFAGLAAAVPLLERRGLSLDDPTIGGHRVARLAVACEVLAVSTLVAALALLAFDAAPSRSAALLAAFAVTSSTLLGAAAMVRRLGLSSVR